MSTAESRELDPKYPAEIVPITFDFAELTSAPISPVVTVARHSGSADASPATMLTGSPQVVGTQVRQKINGGVAGANYTIACQVDTADGSRFVLEGILRVVDQ